MEQRHMHPNTFRAALLISALAILISPAHAVTYTATLLHPDDFIESSAIGVSNASQVGNGNSPDFAGPAHAMLWTGSAASVVDLNPTDFFSSYATGATTTTQVGYGSGTTTGFNNHAVLWTGTAGSVVDLHPAGFTFSYALDVSGSNQVGYGYKPIDNGSHALLWSGTAASKVDLNPSGFTESYANGISGNSQVGYGIASSTGDSAHALLWSGTAASKVDLNPTGFTESYGNGISGTKQVGSGAGSATGAATHALLWSGTAASKVDLHPTGFDFSEALGVSSAGQVGDGFGASTLSSYHALYWNGTAASVIDLHPSLSALGYDFVSSTAFAISDNGNVVGTATDDGNFTHAILWTPQSTGPPETGVAGDYNNNGAVDAGDYIAWRKGNNPLHNEVATIGSNTSQDYTEWRARFGNPPGSGTGALAGVAIPEPSAIALSLLLCAVLLTRLRVPLLTR
jgi:probable HAF family extracellular repeat protein